MWGKYRVCRVKQNVLSHSQHALNWIVQSVLQLYIHCWPPRCFITSIVPSAQMDLHNSVFSGSPWSLLTAAQSSVSLWGRWQNVFYACFLPSTRREDSSVEMCRQSSLGVADALDVPCTRHVLSSFQHQSACRVSSFLCSSREVEAVVCVWSVGFDWISVWYPAGQHSTLVLTRTEQLKSLTMPTH